MNWISDQSTGNIRIQPVQFHLVVEVILHLYTIVYSTFLVVIMASMMSISMICTVSIRRKIDGVWWKQEVWCRSHVDDRFAWWSTSDSTCLEALGIYIYIFILQTTFIYCLISTNTLQIVNWFRMTLTMTKCVCV